jgi:thiamine biosynthesis lipoprotein
MTATVLGIADDRALGSSLRLIVTRPQSLARAKAAVDDVIRAVDVAASRFRDDSELTMLNARPDQVTIVSPLLAAAIAAALRGAELTRGAVDPTIGAAMRLVGYEGDFASIEADGPPLCLVARSIPGWKAIRFSAATRSIVIPRGVELDLGATAKALAADLSATAAHRTVGGGVLVSLGGDIAVAGAAPSGGWLVQASEDSAASPADTEETVSIASGGVASSGTTVRRWVRGGVELHHIIDPATGLPADSCWRSATVVAGSCVDANIASTGAIVMSDKAVPWLVLNQLAARLVHRNGSVHRIAGWPNPVKSKPIPTIL